VQSVVKNGSEDAAGLSKSALDRGKSWHIQDHFLAAKPPAMRDDYIKEAQKVIPDPNVLINVVSRRVKQLRQGNRSLVESLEKLTPEDLALREIIEGKISYDLSEV
jgi:DNA-directed RNA polymerase subunit omega